MLVVQRKPGEVTIVTIPPSSEPTTVTVELVSIRRKSGESPCARLGFNAPRQVAIHRSEAINKQPPTHLAAEEIPKNAL